MAVNAVTNKTCVANQFGNAITIKQRLYLLDWDSTARAETITIIDAATSTVLNTQTYSGFHNGEYAACDITGHVVIQGKKTGGSNAVVSGLFFD